MAEEKKIFIDEDWKSQVEAEKEQLEKKRQAGAAGETASAQQQPGPGQMPPASFEMLLSTLATEAMVALGQLPHPATGTQQLNLDQAKFFVDTIDILEEKTKGNLDPQEERGLTELIHQLRMVYVNVRQQVQAQAGAEDAK